MSRPLLKGGENVLTLKQVWMTVTRWCTRTSVYLFTAAALGALLADYTPRSRWESYDDEEEEWRPPGRRLWETPFV